MNLRGGLPERLKVELKSARRNSRESRELIFAFGAIEEIVGIAVVINVHTEFHGVLPDHFGDVVGEFVTVISCRQLETITAEYESAVGILDYDAWAGRWSARQVEVIIVSVMKTQLVRGTAAERGLE